MHPSKDAGLEKRPANHVPLSPVTFLEQAAAVYPTTTAVIDGEHSYDYLTFRARARRLASALRRRGIGPGDTVAILAPNVPAMLEAHYGVPGCGAVLNTINTRLAPETVSYILEHGEAKALIVDRDCAELARQSLALVEASMRSALLVVGDESSGGTSYEGLLLEGDPDEALRPPNDEWDSLALSYTSGTTGRPKGVVYHHRGAYLNALANVAVWELGRHPVYLWVLPMFHSLGWCFPWTLSVVAGTHVCLRKVEPDTIFDLIEERQVTHLCGAPTVLDTLARAAGARRTPHRVRIMTAASPPPPSVIARVEACGFDVLHVYGLTEVFGPATVCAPRREWETLTPHERATKKIRQGVAYPTVEALRVVERGTMRDVPRDGRTVGEVVIKGNTVMRGYRADPAASDEAFLGGAFHTGDLAVCHPDGYIEIRDRAKDIIISGGENIASIEVENALYQHPDIADAAVVARPDHHWGETPCAFIDIRAGATVSTDEVVTFCRERLAHFMVPKTVIFGPLPKTSTGKIQKFLLRERARLLGSETRERASGAGERPG